MPQGMRGVMQTGAAHAARERRQALGDLGPARGQAMR